MFSFDSRIVLALPGISNRPAPSFGIVGNAVKMIRFAQIYRTEAVVFIRYGNLNARTRTSEFNDPDLRYV